MKKKIASMLAATVMLFSVIALPASAQTDWLGNSDLTTAKVREIADADTLTESQIAEINNHYSEYEIMQGISKTLIEDYAARINPDNPPHCAVCAGFDDLYLHYIDNVYLRLGYDGSNYDIQRGYDYTIFQGIAWGNKTFLNERKQFQAVRRFGAQHAYKSDYYNTGAMTIRLGNVIENNGVNSVYDGYILASDGTAYNVRVNAPNGYYQPGNTYDDLNPVLIKLGYTNSLGVYVEENFAYLLAPDCSYADLEELSNLANEAIGAQMKWKEAAAEQIAEKNQGNNAEDLVRITFEQMVDFYKKIYPDSTLINTEKGILESINSASSEMEEAKTSDLGYSVEDAELYEGKFYIYKRMATHYDDTLLGSLQKELDSFNTSKAIEWLAYDVDYLMGEAYPGETAYVLITEDEYTFSKQGAYKLTYVDTGKTTELVNDQGFRWEASVYFVVDEDTYNENLQKMFRAEQALYDTYERILNNFGLAE